MTLHMKRVYFFLNHNFLRPMGKLKSIFELAENLTLVLTKLDTELGLAQPQLVANVIRETTDRHIEVLEVDVASSLFFQLFFMRGCY